jgi:hypothetical protein
VHISYSFGGYLFLLEVARLAQTWVIVLVRRLLREAPARIQGRGPRPGANVVDIILSVHPPQSVTKANARAGGILWCRSRQLILRVGGIGDANCRHGLEGSDEGSCDGPQTSNRRGLYTDVIMYGSSFGSTSDVLPCAREA